MTTERTTAAATSALAIVTLAFFLGGCKDSLLGSNQAECEKAIRHSITCAAPSSADLPPEFDLYVSLLCASVPETSECDGWSALADCVTSIDCTDFSATDPQTIEACTEISTELVENACIPTGFGPGTPTGLN